MKSRHKDKIQYTVRDVPSKLNEAIRKAAKQSSSSINQIVLDALRNAFLTEGDLKASACDELQSLIGSWKTDEEVDRAISEQRQVDLEEWR